VVDESHLLRGVLDNLYEGVYCLDPQRRIFFWNKGAERITGYRAEEVLGRSCEDNILCHVDAQGRNLCREGCPVARAMRDGRRHEGDLFLLHKNGYRKPVRVRVAPIEDADGAIVGAMEIFSDDISTENLRQRIARLEKLSALDPLTRLPNRRSMEAVLTARLAESRRYGDGFGILFIDIDHFKAVNDAHGHETGDQVLRLVAKTLARTMRPFDVAGRWGGEEFLAIVFKVERSELAMVAERVRALIAQTRIPIGDAHMGVTVSIGATLVQKDDSLEGLIGRADRLMYRSKMKGRDQVSLEFT
jgi:diguanylate cyclase (GGDEF)-like protein/PAS domain S-box-containing protein